MLAGRSDAAVPHSTAVVVQARGNLELAMAAIPNNVFGYFQVYAIPMAIAIMAIMLLSFCCGLGCRSSTGFFFRFMKGGWQLAWHGATRLRTVGVQAPCTYARDRDPSRFLAYENGFRRGGEVTVERHD